MPSLALMFYRVTIPDEGGSCPWLQDASATRDASALASETNVAFVPVGILSKRWGSYAEWERHTTASLAERLLGQGSALILETTHQIPCEIQVITRCHF